MPIEFRVGEAIELLRYGKFTLLSLAGTIPAVEAVTITETPSVKPPAVEAVYHIVPGWIVLTERFNWGETSRPDKVYYELWQYGKTIPTAYQEGFYCGSMIRGSNIDNICTHIFAADRIHVKLWNATGAAPEDVYYDFTVWYYTYMAMHHDKVMAIFLKTPDTLKAILEVLKNIAVPPAELAKIEEKLDLSLEDLSAIRKRLCI